MKRLENLTNDSFVKSLELNLKENSKYFFYLQSWQDGDAFLDVCDVDGGIKTEQVLLFAEKNKQYIFKKYTTFNTTLFLNTYFIGIYRAC